MEKYCIFIVSPEGYIHSHTFDEMALTFQDAFRQLGADAPIVNDPAKITGRPLVFGANLIPFNPSIVLPPDAIIYNSEQVTIGSQWFNMDYIKLLQNYQVWDCSTSNLNEMAKLSIPKASYCGFGYAPALTKIKPADRQDIDVLFYGSINERRKAIISTLRKRGLKATILVNAYGDERDAFIARSKISINIHYYETKIFELLRVSYLLSNRIFVISESGADGELEKPFEGGIVVAPYEKLVEQCIKYIKKDKLRAEIAERGFHLFEAMPQVKMLEEALQHLE